MKLSWILVILLLVFVAVFSVQNAEPITVRFITWEITMSAALVIQLAALLGGLVGLTVGALSRRPRRTAEETPAALPAPAEERPEPSALNTAPTTPRPSETEPHDADRPAPERRDPERRGVGEHGLLRE